jgi:strawberry notch-like protein/NTP hydrolase family protein
MDTATRLLLLSRKTRSFIVAPSILPTRTAFQDPYEPVSRKKDSGILCPRHMRAPMRETMERILPEIGDVDTFVARELQYNSIEEMHRFFMGTQVDGIALSIWQIKKNRSLIVSDQTGLGKGRQAAAICRWAVLNRMLPIFCTYSDTLFSDFYRDLDDIEFSSGVWPLLFNGGASITEQSTGRKIFANRGSMKSILEHISQTGELPRGRNAVFLTYSQINVENVQQQALRVLAPKAVFILDESHSAGGDESNTGLFVQEVLPSAIGVMFLSATWAKRADNLPVYATKTDISIAIPEAWRVADAVRAGGEPLQTVVSHQLAEAGQLIRRELSFEGISILNFIDDRNQAEHETISDQVTEVLRAIVKADLEYHNNDFEQARIWSKRNGLKIYHHKFSAIVHNVVKQFLLALKCDAAADCAIESIGKGEKPIIALESTMGAFLDSYVAAMGLSEGSILEGVSWAMILRRLLERTLHHSYVNRGKRVRIEKPRSALCESTAELYRDADKLLDALSVTIPVSPIDWMRHRIASAGHAVAEITGRGWRVNYSGPVPILSQVPSEERQDRVKTGLLFNNGGIDALILNQAGSTGISLHAHEKFKDQKRRHMIIAQPAGDVNVFMQQLGRINRTGQVTLPRFTMMAVALPAEIRPSVNLARKLKSLNANTSSNTRSAMSVEAPDLMNKYGDKIVAEWLHENPHIAELMGLTMDKSTEEGGITLDDLARVATGRSALLPVKEQREFIETISESYIDYISYLDETGQNDLEPRTYDFDAEQKTSHVVYRGTDEKSPFGQDAVFGIYSIKRQGKSYTPAEVEAKLLESFGDYATMGWQQRDTMLARDLSHRLEDLYAPYLAGLEAQHVIDRAGKIREYGRSILSEFRVGSGLRVDINDDIYNGIIYRIDGRKNVSGNPYAPSSLKFYIAVNGPLREVRVPGSQIKKITLQNLGRNASPAELFQDHLSDTRQRCKLITGNLLSAYGQLKPGKKGRIISFSMNDGSVKQGILMPVSFDWEKDLTPQKV